VTAIDAQSACYEKEVLTLINFLRYLKEVRAFEENRLFLSKLLIESGWLDFEESLLGHFHFVLTEATTLYKNQT
jgi:hypothetical protein